MSNSGRHDGDGQRQGEKEPQGHGERAVLKHGRSAVISDIGAAVTTKYDKVFMLTSQTGDILPTNSGYGLYFRDTCYIDQLELRLHGQLATPLMSDASRGSVSLFELTNPEIHLDDGKVLPKEKISIQRKYTLHHQVTQEISFHNLDQRDVEFDVSFTYNSHFTNMFVVRGSEPGKRGTLHPPAESHGTLVLAYDGADRHRRTATVGFSPSPASIDGGTVTYHLKLKSHEKQQIRMTIDLEDKGTGSPTEHKQHAKEVRTPASEGHRHKSFDEQISNVPQVTSNNPLFDRAFQRSLHDIRMLAMADHGDVFIAAGVPWFVALFGRDGAISSFQTLAFQPEVARSTLRVLASYQGTRHNDFQDEEPGKILHELRVGEKANLHEVPQIPYYGTVDATPWFLILLGEYVRWTGDLDLFGELQGNAERALQWIDNNMKQSPTGFLSYGTKSSKGLSNQGWKDSGNSIVNDDGSLAKAPIALVEVQAYVYKAKRLMANLFRQCGEPHRADNLEKEAEELKKRFNDKYWMSDKGFYALALQDKGEQARAIASNPGQTLFTGIVDDNKVPQIAKLLMSGEMFCGWGIRTLASTEKAYNPLDYQVGSVWPHDNSIIGLGLRRCGCRDEMARVFTGIFNAAAEFDHYRLPEVFDGFSSDQYHRPVHYPVACSPQAWAAGALPLFLQTALGLEPEAPRQLLRIHNPCLPEWLDMLTIKGLHVGKATVDLRYRREADATLVAVLKCQGDLDVQVEY